VVFLGCISVLGFLVLFLGYFVGVFGWVLLWVVFLGVVLVLGGCFGFSYVYHLCT